LQYLIVFLVLEGLNEIDCTHEREWRVPIRDGLEGIGAPTYFVFEPWHVIVKKYEEVKILRSFVEELLKNSFDTSRESDNILSLWYNYFLKTSKIISLETVIINLALGKTEYSKVETYPYKF